MISAQLRHKIADYRPDAKKLDAVRQTPFLLAVGITAAGKNAIMHRLMAKHPADYHYAVSHTTRRPRAGEKDGKNYHFVSLSTIEELIDRQVFVEVKIVHQTDIYASSIEEIAIAQRHRQTAISDIDVQGVEEFVRAGLNVTGVFVLPPDFDVWKKRLLERDPNLRGEKLKDRLQSALSEIDFLLRDDFFHIVVNDDLGRASEEFHAIAQGRTKQLYGEDELEAAQMLKARIKKEISTLD